MRAWWRAHITASPPCGDIPLRCSSITRKRTNSRPIRMHRRLLLLCSCVLAVTGCHTFKPVSIDEIAPGQTLRARVTGAYSDSLQAMIGLSEREFEGVVVERRTSSILIEIPVQQAFQGMRFQTLAQRVEIPDAALVEVATKELDRTRSYVAAGIAAVVLGAVIVTQLNKDSGGSQRPGPGSPQDAKVSIPLARLPLAAISWLWGR